MEKEFQGFESKEKQASNKEAILSDPTQALNGLSNTPSFLHSKTSLRMHYEAQVQVIQGQVGSLEEIRMKLGLSARKICQLLMVDPSTWTRWTRRGDSVPPHIWRALQWYLIIQEKIPGLTPGYFIGKEASPSQTQTLQRLEEQLGTQKLLLEQNEQLKKKIQNLEFAVKANRVTAIMMGIAGVILAFAFFRMLRG